MSFEILDYTSTHCLMFVPVIHLGGYGGYGGYGGGTGGFYPGAAQKAAKIGTADGRKCPYINVSYISCKGCALIDIFEYILYI